MNSTSFPLTTTALSGIDVVYKTAYSSIPTSTSRAIITEHPQITFVRETYIWLVPLMISILMIAIIGNSLIVISSPWLSPPVTPYLRLCVSLAAADMWAASLLTAGLIVNSYLTVVIRIRKKSDCFAAILEVFRIGGMLTSDLHLFALAINQFVGITWPLKYKPCSPATAYPQQQQTHSQTHQCSTQCPSVPMQECSSKFDSTISLFGNTFEGRYRCTARRTRSFNAQSSDPDTESTRLSKHSFSGLSASFSKNAEAQSLMC
ncbi:unnamed protein product [Anisakis simplex]|uniref:G_PROTEIN_RECEP_F1_2 domain-containing protein n=1 Tax=Anisakis simplex TaxID=6269 RepID=A0A158PP52_ANISI|nr:unnamed protein product [Anisakis simplex]